MDHADVVVDRLLLLLYSKVEEELLDIRSKLAIQLKTHEVDWDYAFSTSPRARSSYHVHLP